MENLNDTRQNTTGQAENRPNYSQSYQSQYKTTSQSPYYRQQMHARPPQMTTEEEVVQPKKKEVLTDQSKGILFGLLGGFLLLGAVIFLVLMLI